MLFSTFGIFITSKIQNYILIYRLRITIVTHNPILGFIEVTSFSDNCQGGPILSLPLHQLAYNKPPSHGLRSFFHWIQKFKKIKLFTITAVFTLLSKFTAHFPVQVGVGVLKIQKKN